LIKKIFSNSFWLLIGSSIGRLSMFLTNIVAARLLSQDEFGQFSMIRNTVSTLEGVISGTIGTPIIKRSAEKYNNDSFNTVFKILFIINLIISAILASSILLFAPYITEIFFEGNIVIIQGLYIGAFLLIATSLSTFIQNIFIGIEKYQKLAVASLYTSLLSFPIILFLIDSYKLYGAIYGIVLYFLIDFIFKYNQFKKLKLKQSKKINMRLLKDEAKKLFFFSYPLFGAVLISSISFWYARVIIINTDGFSSLAVFDAAFQWLTIIMIITGTTTSVVLPMLSKINQKKDSNQYQKTILANIGINLIISSCFAFIFAFFSKEIMSIYGENYTEGYKVLVILSVTSIFFSLSSIMNKVYISLVYTKEILYIISFSAISMIFLLKSNLLHNIIGLAYAFLYFYIMSFFLYLCCYTAYTHEFLGNK
jgi:O-antigen/teichoic acid export membrane protein